MRSETASVLEKSIPVSGKPLRDHMEAVGHKDTLDYILTLAQRDEKIRETEIRRIHSLVVGRSDPEYAGAILDNGYGNGRTAWLL